MEFNQNQSREYGTDVLNQTAQASNSTYGLYDPHPYLKDRVHSDNRTRTSFQDSNVFGYKQDSNVTWQNPGRDTKGAGIRSGVYNHAYSSPDNVVYDPNATMAQTATVAGQTFVAPTPDMYQHNDPQIPKSRLGAEVFGMADFNRQAAKADLQSRDAHWLSQGKTENSVAGLNISPQDRKQLNLHSAYSNHQPVSYQAPAEELKTSVLDSWKNSKI